MPNSSQGVTQPVKVRTHVYCEVGILELVAGAAHAEAIRHLEGPVEPEALASRAARRVGVRGRRARKACRLTRQVRVGVVRAG
jgi:hypothetical protein